MLRWVWWTVVGCLGFVACGGSSLRNDAGNDGSSNDDQSTGGMPGSGGATSGTGGSNGGTTNPTGGRGGTTAGRGGTTSGGGGTTGGRGGTGGEGAGAGEPSTGGDAGGGGRPVCELAGGVTCSFEDSCTVLGCGKAWSHYDENRCGRTGCEETGLCEAGERCVAAPVAGRFDDPCGNQADSCDVTASGCECLYYEECFPSAVCLPVGEFPPDDDCPIAELDCEGLEQAAATLRGYLDGDAFLEPYEPPGNIASSLQACLDAVAARALHVCEE
ncbi:MAG TPA: hypothetical protein VFZ53_24630 [Polyangiaceae bacterium]